MIYKTAIADAYGVAWEFTKTQRAPNDLSGYSAHPTHVGLRAGDFTDDTLRSMANAGVILSDERNWFDPAAYAQAYQTIHRELGREGWSRGFQAYLNDNAKRSPQEFMRGLNRRDTNGAVMGAAPLGYLPDDGAVRLAAAAQTISTHAAGAIQHAQAISLAAHYLIRRLGPRDGMKSYLEAKVDWQSADEMVRTLHTDETDLPSAEMPAWTVTTCALWAVTNMNSLSDMLRWCCDKGRDTDSLSAVTIAIASCADDVAQDLPRHLHDMLECNNPEGDRIRAELKLIDTRLSELRQNP